MNNLPTLDNLNNLLDSINEDVQAITSPNYKLLDYEEVCRIFLAQKLVIEAIECHYYEDQD